MYKRQAHEYMQFSDVPARIYILQDLPYPDVLELMNSDLPVVTIVYVHHNCTAVSSFHLSQTRELTSSAAQLRTVQDLQSWLSKMCIRDRYITAFDHKYLQSV